MTEQYIIAYFGDATLVVDAVGPFRSLDKAERALEKLSRADDNRSENFDVLASGIPQLVRLQTLAEALEDFERTGW